MSRPTKFRSIVIGSIVLTAACESATIGPADGGIESVSIAPQPAVVEIDATLQLQVTLLGPSGSELNGRQVFWSAEDASVAAVSATGVVTGRALGSTRVAASAEGRSATATVTVVQPSVTRIEVSPARLDLVTGQSSRLTAVPRDRADRPIAGRTLSWSSGDTRVATVDGGGLVTAVAQGSTTITVAVDGVSVDVPVTVARRAVAAVEVVPGIASLVVGAEQPFTAIARAADATVLPGREVFWSSTNPAVLTITAAGVARAVAPGAATINALVEGVTGTANVSVSVVPVASVQITSASGPLTVGGTRQLTATALSEGGAPLANRVITWTSSSDAIARVSSTGLVTAVAPGGATITAAVEGKSATTALTVVPVAVASVTIAPTTAQLAVGGSQTFSATARDAQGNVLTGRSATWTTGNGSIATVTSAGVVTAVAAGQTSVTVTVEGQSASATVTVSPVAVATVDIDPTSAALVTGGTRQFTATAKAADGSVLSGRAVTWSTSAPTVASVTTGGLVTALAPGQATITATIEGKSASATVTVSAVPVATVEVTPTSAQLTVGGTQQFTATTKAADGTVLTGRSVSWSSNAPSVASVSSGGLVTAVGAGQATITATSEGKTATATVTVTLIPVATVEVSPASVSLPVGGTQQLTAVTRAADGSVLTGRVVTWTSSNPLVASVNTSGSVTALLAGDATITATSEGKSGTASVVVVLAVQSVQISPTSPEILVGGTQQFTATVIGTGGVILTDRPVTWETSNPAVATINSSGLATGVAVGETTITARSDGKSANTKLKVKVAPQPASLVIVSGNNQTGTNNQPLPAPLVVAVLDAGGQPVPGVTVSWTADNGSVNPTTSVTAADGTASTTWTWGSGGGNTRRAYAAVTGLPVVEFVATRESQ